MTGVLDLPDGATVLLLIRHAERPPLPPDPSGRDVPLTPRGEDQAATLGRSFGARLGRVHASPITRCLATARALARDRPVVSDLRLGDPGPFVADLERAWADWRLLGHDGVLARLCSGDDVLPGLHPLRETTRALITSLLATVACEPGIHVFVTHDVVVAPVASVLLGRPLAETEWPAFLESLAIVDGADPYVVYRGERRPIGAFLAGEPAVPGDEARAKR